MKTMLVQKLKDKSWEDAYNHGEIQIGFVDFTQAEESLAQYLKRMQEGGVDTMVQQDRQAPQ